MAMASNKADSTSKLMEKPIKLRKKNVPMSDTGTAISGISVERQSCRNTYTTMNTRMSVRISVNTTSSIEAKRNSVTSMLMRYSSPGGNDLDCSSSTFLQSRAIWVALEPATCCTIPMTDGIPLSRMATLYVRAPSLMSATSFSFSVWPLASLEMMMLPNSSAVFSRPV